MARLAIFVTPTSACELTVVGSVDELLVALLSPPPVTVALLLRPDGADWLTVTLTVIRG